MDTMDMMGTSAVRSDAMEDFRYFRVDEHIFRVHASVLSSPAEVYRDGRWQPVVLTAEEVLTLMNAHELTLEETRELDLPG
jgi:hypothetical protein